MSDESTEMAKWMREWAATQERERAARFDRLRSTILPVLRQARVATAVLDYDGYGDSTSDYTLTFRDAKNKVVDSSNIAVDENELIDILFCAVPPGYENNDGGFGLVILDVVAGAIRNEHSQRYTETTYSEEEFTL